MSRYLKRFIKKILQRIADGTGLPQQIAALQQQIAALQQQTAANSVSSACRGIQILLSQKYQELLANNLPLPQFQDVEFRAFSQNGEDGLLLYIFSLVGTTNKKAVEICAGDGIQCNTANLIINHGWDGLLFDGDENLVKRGRAFYKTNPDTFVLPPQFVHAWITSETVDSLIRGHGFEGEIDLLSLDMDGVDYWVWKAIDCIQPRVVVLEYNWVWGPDKSMAIPNKPDFKWKYTGTDWPYFGASLPAFVKLAREKGYRLVGCQQWGFNAFFLRSDVGTPFLPEIPASRCFELPLQKRMWYPGRLDATERFEWVEV